MLRRTAVLFLSLAFGPLRKPCRQQHPLTPSDPPISFVSQIKAQTSGKFFRKDLAKPALARWYKLWKAQNRTVEDEE